MSGNLTEDYLRDYYHSLSRKEKGAFLQKVMSECGFAYATLQSKITGRLPFRKMELLAIDKIMEGT